MIVFFRLVHHKQTILKDVNKTGPETLFPVSVF